MMRSGARTCFIVVVSWIALAVGTSTGCAGVPECEFNSQCSDGFYCVDGKCVRDCADAAFDCPAGFVCNANGQCEESGEAVGPAGAGGATSSSSEVSGAGQTTSQGGASSAMASSGSTTSSSVSSNASSSSGGGMGNKPVLEVCASGAECASGNCRPLSVGGKSRCTTSCTSSLQCPSGFRCLGPANSKVCLDSDVGRSCNTSSTCNFDCLIVQGGPKYCTAPCSTGADCPNGFACNDGPGLSVCIRAEGLCNTGADCTQACDTGLLLSGCTSLCKTASDCPQRAAPLPAWSCFGGYCVRPPDVYGTLEGGYSPTEYYCVNNQVVNLCNDGQTINFTNFTIPQPPNVNCNSSMSTPGGTGDSCVNTCRYKGGCKFGYSCVGVGAYGSERIGLCLPDGTVEPGGACASNTNCAFGYCSNGTCSRDCTVDGMCPTGTTCLDKGPPLIEGMSFKTCQ